MEASLLFSSLFDAFTGLAVLLAFAIALGMLLCLPELPDEQSKGEWTLRPRRQRSHRGVAKT